MTEPTPITARTTDRDDNGVSRSSDGIANILIVEHDTDCSDALEVILAGVPGITAVQTAIEASDALELLDTPDVVGFSMAAELPASLPDVIFIGADQPDPPLTETTLLDTLTAFRALAPEAAIVLLCVYPERYREALAGLIDACIRKDTSARELRALIDHLRAARAASGQRASA